MLWILAVAGFGTLGHICVARSYALSETSEVAALDFVQLVAAAAIGYFFFAESPDQWTWIGAALISGAAIYITRREARLRHERAIADAPPTGVGPAP
ncbi:MAG: DMT family transporter, partial [Alphaproteobacteria bacterium]